jgi:hypothetical protein
MAIYRLTDVDGVECLLGPTAMVVFFDVNDFVQETVDDIENLDVGETYVDGGGAAPAWQIERIR